MKKPKSYVLKDDHLSRHYLHKVALLIVFLIAGGFWTSALAQKKSVTLHLENASVVESIKQIGKVTGLEFFYNSNQLTACTKKITVSYDNEPLENVLNHLFIDTNFTFKIENKTIVILPKPTPQKKESRSIEVKGCLTDNRTGEPLIGASVGVEESNKWTITDAKGEYILHLNNYNQSIQFSYVGYTTLVKRLTESNLASFEEISLVAANLKVDDVVVTGIYTRKKDNFTGSSATFKTADLTRVGTQNILQSLRTLDPSFKIMENNQFGSDPNRMPDIEIRGKSSVMGLKEEYGKDPNQPLFILDGFETTLAVVSDLNMSRVASVTLLKDATSTAIYGSRAANGVVVIETKRPENGRLRLSYKGDFSFAAADLSDYNLMNAREKMLFEEKAGLYNDLTGDPMNQLRLDDLRNRRKQEIERGVDSYWLSEPLRTGFTHKHNLYVDGGEKKIQYGLGFSYANTQGVMKGSDRETLSGNIDLIYRTGKFQFSNKTIIGYNNTNDPSVSFSKYALTNPYYRKYNADRGIDKYLYYSSLDESLIGNNASEVPVENPLWNAMLNNYDKSSEFNFTNNFIAEWFIITDLKAQAKFGLYKAVKNDEGRLSPLHTDFDQMPESEKGFYSNDQFKDLNYEGDVSLTYGHIFNDLHMLNAVAGFNFSSKNSMLNGYRALGFTEDQFGAPSFANSYPVGQKPRYSESDVRAASFYFNGGYSYDNRYLADVNYRRDGASMFGSNKRFRDTWSAGIGWNIHNEKFFDNSNLFQLLKIRASVGNPGNQNFDAYQAFSTYAFTQMSNIFGTGILLDGLGNPDLAWQETTNYTVGADIIMFQNRLSLTVDLYQKMTSPLLAIITTPGSLGVKSLAMNAGEMDTKGIEASVKYSPIYRPNEGINWNITANIRSLKSKYKNIGNSFSKLNEEGQAQAQSTIRYYDGGSPSDIWAVPSLGIDPSTGQELFIKKDGTRSFVYDVSDERVIGNTEPKIEGVLGTNLFYKGFTFGIYFRYRMGGQLFNSALYNKVENIGLHEINYNQDKRALYDRWSEVGQEARYKRISLVQKTDKSSRFVMDENTISGESLNIGYEFTQSFIKKIGLSALTLQGTMNDFFRASSVKSERGIDYPFARTFSISLSAIF